MNSTSNIYGYVRSTQTKLPVEGMKVLLFFGGDYLVAQTQSKAEGFFQLIVSGATLDTLFPSGNVMLTFEVRDAANHLLLSQSSCPIWTPELKSDINLWVNADLVAKTIAVQGRVVNANGLPAVGTPVRIREKAFRLDNLLTEGITNAEGYYNLSVNTRNILTATADKPATGVVEVMSKAGVAGKVIAISDDLALSGDTLAVNFNLLGSVSRATEEYADLKNTIIAKVGDIDLSGVGVEDTSEVQQLSAATGFASNEVQSIVTAHKLSTDLQLDTDAVYALVRNSDPSGSELINLDSNKVEALVTNAIETGIVRPDMAPDIPEVQGKVADYQIKEILKNKLGNEKFTLKDGLDVIFNNSTFAEGFIAKIQDFDGQDINGFWAKYALDNGAANKSKAQATLQLMAVTGNQPVLSKRIYDNTSGSIAKMAKWDDTQWVAHINAAAVGATVPIVPVAIGEDTTLGRAKYASKLKAIAQELYPLTTLAGKLETSGYTGLVSDNAVAQDMIKFINQNPQFDFRTQSVHDIKTGSVDLTGIADVAKLKGEIAPFQRLTRIAGAKPDAIEQLKRAGITTAQQIAAMPSSKFVADYSAALGGMQEAMNAFGRAVQVAQLSAQAVVDIQTASGAVIDSTLVLPDIYAQPEIGADPDLATLFGSLDQCGCEYCMSVYSPSAYFVDVMNFIKTHSTTNSAFDELMWRRPDLKAIDLTCKNANTPLPYIDLVNELLEREILKTAAIPGLVIPVSFQTSGTAADLAAHPEHVSRKAGTTDYEDYKETNRVYDTVLKSAVYPFNLPFNRAMEEARVYLKHLGFTRYELVNLFRPITALDNMAGSNTSNEITAYNLASESLGISKEAADVIIGKGSAAAWNYFGFANAAVTGYVSPSDSAVLLNGHWTELLAGTAKKDAAEYGGLDVVLQQTGLSYKEFLMLLDTYSLNPVYQADDRRIKIVSRDNMPVDTCVLKNLKLEATLPAGVTDIKVFYAAFFDKLHRFVRLWKATKLSIQELDALLVSFNLDQATGTDFLKIDSYILVARAIQLAGQTLVPVNTLATWWSLISDLKYTNVASERQELLPSQYDKLFRNKSVVNPTDSAFDNYNTGNYTGSYTLHTAAVIAACGITDKEYKTVIGKVASMGDNMNLSKISRLYAAAALSKSQGLPVDTFCYISDLVGKSWNATISNFSDRLDQLEYLLRFVAELGATRLSLEELEYALMGKDDKAQFFAPEENINTFYFEKLQAELKKVALEAVISDESKKVLKNILRQQFAAHFGLDTAMALSLLSTLKLKYKNTTTELVAEEVLIDLPFINSTLVTDPFAPGALADLYRAVERIGWWTKKMVLSTEHFDLFSANLVNLNIWNPFEKTGTASDFGVRSEKLFRFAYWVKIRDRFAVSKDNFSTLLNAAANTAGNPETSKDSWISTVVAMTGWDTQTLTSLVGVKTTPATNTGYLGAVSNGTRNDFADAALLWRVATIMDVSNRVGLTPDQLIKSMKADIQMDDAVKILKAAKARYTDEQWNKIAKPLRDALREKQRTALVAHMVAAGGKKWRNENELYAYFLMDPGMSACMKTSRLKQAISSLQLFTDRVILNLETVQNNPAQMISFKQESIEQWEAWRKWYRIWEANRKIFLYPENWIEPELRDDKSPFFKELETQLLQDEVTEDKVEAAYLEYLENVDTTARMEPVTAYHQYEAAEGIDIIHVIARTQSQPHLYYYRKLENEVWTPWEKMNIEPKGDHVTAVVWNRRLHLFWLTFVEKPMEEDANPEMEEFKRTYNTKWTSRVQWSFGKWEKGRMKYWNIMLNWSEYNNGKWASPKVSKDSMGMIPYNVQITEKARQQYNNISSNDYKTIYNLLSSKYELSVNEVFRNRLYLSPVIEPGGDLCLSLLFPGGVDELAIGLHNFIFSAGAKTPAVMRDNNRGYKMLAPANTLINSMKFVENPVNNMAGKDNAFSLDNIGKELSQQYYIYATDEMSLKNYADPIRSGDGSIILEATPCGPFRITARSGMAQEESMNFDPNPLTNHFFFEDDRNTFFVKRKDTAFENGIITGIVRDPNQISFPALEDAFGTFYGKVFVGGTTGSQFTLASNVTAKFAVTNLYQFQTFYHPHVNNFVKQLKKKGIKGLMTLANQVKSDSMNFSGNYKPKGMVHTSYPQNNVDFEYSGTYSIYNWELFFHIPMLVAQRLMDNQQFEAARKWFHFVFDPTSNADENGNITGSKKRFWKFRPFYEEAGTQILTLTDLMNNINQYKDQIKAWENNPFQPHLIARMRHLAYMKNVVMKYIDNLMAWGDQLFRRDTIESINEATQLYILAANILGAKPQEIPARAVPELRNFDEIGNSLDAFSNAQVNIETFLGANAAPSWSQKGTNAPDSLKMAYFCLPNNEKLLGYWGTVADRLFKIRNCRNIDGVVRQLPLYEPPIDPALLVRARAMGMDINSILDDASGVNLPHYRFAYMLQKANELAGDVRSLGGALQSALEKKDAEEMALIRTGHEKNLLEKVKMVREAQVEEASTSIEALQKTKEVTQQRMTYYQTRQFTISGEQQHLQSLQTGMILQSAQGGLQAAAGVVSALPQFHVQGLASGLTSGGMQITSVLDAASAGVGILANINNTVGSMAITQAGYQRRQDDWTFQADSAKTELEQIDKQLLAAAIRLDIAKKELTNHELQMENSEEADSMMRDKYTNKELYQWMVSQMSAVYFQAYQLAFELARKAENCFKQEIPLVIIPVGGFIRFGYWDSLRKGLLAGEKLQFDLRKLEAAWTDNNKRCFELTKHVSLALLNPMELIRLREEGECEIQVPEELYALDYPGHYNRRIKSVSISIPCVTGPYTTVAATLALTGSYTRKKSSYTVDAVTTDKVVVSSIATSNAQNDSGMFELNFRDERYLPFEGAGAVSYWNLKLVKDNNLRQFDYSTINDVLLHVKYTAQEGTTVFENESMVKLNNLLSNGNNGTEPQGNYETDLSRSFSLKHEFTNEWHAQATTYDASPSTPLYIRLKNERFPYFCANRLITIDKITINCRPKAAVTGVYKIELMEMGVIVKTILTTNLQQESEAFSFDVDGRVLGIRIKNPAGVIQKLDDLLADMHITVSYKLGESFPGPGQGGDSPYIPSVFPQNMLAWWKADAVDNVLVAGKVDELKDQTGKNNHIKAVSTDKRPVLTDNWKNNQPAVTFAGSQVMKLAQLILPQNTEDVTVFMVGEKTAAATALVFSHSENIATASGFGYTTNDYFAGSAQVDQAVIYINGGWNVHGCPAATTLNEKAIYAVNFHMSNPADAEAFAELNGLLLNQVPPYTLVQTDHVGQSFPSDVFFLGARNENSLFSHFSVAEMMIVPSKVTNEEKDSILAYFEEKYDLKWEKNPLLKNMEKLAWWQADAVNNELVSGKMNMLTDQSTAGHNITAISAGTRPSIITQWSNNKPAMEFDGSQLMKLPMLTIPANTSDITVFMVGEKTSNDLGVVFEHGPGLDQADGFGYIMGNGVGVSPKMDLAYLRKNGNWNAHGGNPAFTLGAKGIYALNFHMSKPVETETSIDFNGFLLDSIPAWNVVQTDSMNQSFLSNEFYLGSRKNQVAGMKFNLAEMIIVPKIATIEEKNAVVAYFEDKYGLTWGEGSVVTPTMDALGWWMADATENELADGRVNVLKDHSGKGHHIPAVANKSPLLSSNWNNGKPAMVFDGSNAMRLPLLEVPANVENMTVIMVGEKTSSDTGCCFELSDNFNTDSGMVFFFNDSSVDEFGISHSGTLNMYGMPSNLSMNKKALFVLTGFFPDPNPETRVEFNGTTYTTPSAWGTFFDHVGATFSSRSFNIGSRSGTANFGKFKMAELMVIPSKLSAMSMAEIKRYLFSKYGLK